MLENELADHDLVGWYRNPTSGTAARRVPWNGGEFDRIEAVAKVVGTLTALNLRSERLATP